MAEEQKGTGLPKNTAAALSYLIAPVTSIVFLLIEKDPFVRFHAMQGVILGALAVLTMIFGWIIALIPIIGWFGVPLWGLVLLIAWLVCIVKAYQGEEFKLPIIGDLAKKQLGKI